MIRHVLCAVLVAGVSAAAFAPQKPLTVAGCLHQMRKSPPAYALGEIHYGANEAPFEEWMHTHADPSGSFVGSNTTPPARMLVTPATGSDVDLSKFVGQDIEITGSPMWGRIDQTGNDSAGKLDWPGFMVSSVKVLARPCRE